MGLVFQTESASPIISSIHLCVKWFKNGAEIKANHIKNGHSASKYVMSESLYFRPGLSYMLRSSRLVPYLVPGGIIPTAGRSQVYPKQDDELWVTALLSSNLATAVARFRGEAFWRLKFQNSMVSAIPFIKPGCGDIDEAKAVISAIRSRMVERFKRDETEILFATPNVNPDDAERKPFDRQSIIGAALDQRIAELCGLTIDEFRTLERDHNEALVRPAVADVAEDDRQAGEEDVVEIEDMLDDFEFKPVLGRGRSLWPLRLASGHRRTRSADRARSLRSSSAKSPGMLPVGEDPFHAHSGILVDDQGDPQDLSRLIEEVLARVDDSVPGDVRRWFQRDFFPFHLQRYSNSRRKAPIYWPLSTTSGDYTLWLYYPA